MNSKLNNIFDLLPVTLDAEVVENIIQTGNIKIERIVSKGHSSSPSEWYDQAMSEWVIVLQGEAIITMENEEDFHLVSGSFLNIPAHSRHRVKWTTSEVETIWLAIHYFESAD